MVEDMAVAATLVEVVASAVHRVAMAVAAAALVVLQATAVATATQAAVQAVLPGGRRFRLPTKLAPRHLHTLSSRSHLAFSA